jgi:hypothetical protein
MFQTDKTKDAVFFEDINGSSRARPRIFVINSALPQEVPLVLLGKHGQVEFALDAIIRSAEDRVVEMGSVSRSQTSSM